MHFHPELDREIMRGYVDARAQAISREGGDPQRLREDVRDTPASAEVLRTLDARARVDVARRHTLTTTHPLGEPSERHWEHLPGSGTSPFAMVHLCTARPEASDA